MHGDNCVRSFWYRYVRSTPCLSSLSFLSFFSKASCCFFFRSKSGNGEAPRRRHLGFSRGACLDRKAETDSLEVCLIRCCAGCPVSIRNPFVGSDLFFRRILSATPPSRHSLLWNRPPAGKTCVFFEKDPVVSLKRQT